MHERGDDEELSHNKIRDVIGMEGLFVHFALESRTFLFACCAVKRGSTDLREQATLHAIQQDFCLCEQFPAPASMPYCI